jgi:hypothetical protein
MVSNVEWYQNVWLIFVNETLRIFFNPTFCFLHDVAMISLILLWVQMVNSLMHRVPSLFNLVEQHSCDGWAEGGTSSELISSSFSGRCIDEGWSGSGDSSYSVGSLFVKLGFGSWSCLLYNPQVNKWQLRWFWRCYLVISMVRIRAIPLSDRAVQGSPVVSVASAGVVWK